MNISTLTACTELCEERIQEEKNIIIVVQKGDTYPELQDLQEKYSQNFHEIEGSMNHVITVACGMRSQGKTVIVFGLAAKITAEGYSAVRQSVCFGKEGLILIGIDGGIGRDQVGAMHQSIQDLSLMRGLPEMSVYCPADGVEAKHILDQVCEKNAPTYIRVNTCATPVFFDPKVKLDIEAKNNIKHILINRSGVTIFATGEMVVPTMMAAERIKERSQIEVSVVNISCMKPLDTELITTALKDSTHGITIENHSIIGGLGAAISEYTSEYKPVKISKIGIRDHFIGSGTREDLLEQLGLDVEGICMQIEALLKGKE